MSTRIIHPGLHPGNKREEPIIPKHRPHRFCPGDKVTLTPIKKLEQSDGDDERKPKTYTFCEKFPHHYSFATRYGYRESFSEFDLQKYVVEIKKKK